LQTPTSKQNTIINKATSISKMSNSKKHSNSPGDDEDEDRAMNEYLRRK
jgi:hypothetical protein